MKGKILMAKWEGRAIQAWVPDLLNGSAFEVSTQVARRTEQAAGAAIRVRDQMPTQFEPLARLLLRNEGIASSFIEGISAPLQEVVAAELGFALTSVPSASVADNLAAVIGALSIADQRLRLEDLHAWHRRLMQHGSSLPLHLIGNFRNVQGWVGGATPLVATFVPAPAELIDPLMIDLVEFANREDIDPVTQGAVVHAQFETIHPYGDGNGRMGRILIGWVLAHRLQLTTPPPVSVFMAKDVGGYLSGLTLARVGQLDLWVDWMATVIKRASDASIELVTAVNEVRDRWTQVTASLRRDATAHRLTDFLLTQPVITSAIVAKELRVSERAAQAAFQQLARLGIVQPCPPFSKSMGRPRQWWTADELLSLIEGWGVQRPR